MYGRWLNILNKSWCRFYINFFNIFFSYELIFNLLSHLISSSHNKTDNTSICFFIIQTFLKCWLIYFLIYSFSRITIFLYNEYTVNDTARSSHFAMAISYRKSTRALYHHPHHQVPWRDQLMLPKEVENFSILLKNVWNSLRLRKM